MISNSLLHTTSTGRIGFTDSVVHSDVDGRGSTTTGTITFISSGHGKLVILRPLALSSISLNPILWDGGREGERRGVTSQPTKRERPSTSMERHRWDLLLLAVAVLVTTGLMKKSFVFSFSQLTVAKFPRSQLCRKVVCWGEKELLATSNNQRCETCIRFKVMESYPTSQHRVCGYKGVSMLLGDCILCYQSSCRSDNNTLCVFDKSTSDLVECHFDELLETLVLVQVGILTPNQTYTNVKDADMWCMHAKATAMWKDGQRQVDYRSCVPPDPLRCEILRNSTQAKYEKLHGRQARVYWDCAMCNTKGCNSADTSGNTPVVLQAVVVLALWVGAPVI
ncbi:unnamed protein product [Timema podura]|uniref:Uncharacterized protein n=1 Tax=Timema podura TaxID=61482 RepID=A0ABN7NWL9_TIMPD|nr:unnamed protein product [Timema podura]